MINHVQDLIKAKGDGLHTVTTSEPVSVAIRKMSTVEIGALPVIEGGKLVGIFSERDVLLRIVDQRLDPDKTSVREVMTGNPKTVTPSHRIDEAMKIMFDGRFRHLPVVDSDVLVGVISIRDVMWWVIRDQRQVIDNLISAVTMSPPSHRRPGRSG